MNGVQANSTDVNPNESLTLMTTWEYSIVALPHFDAPTATRDSAGSPAVALLNAEGRNGWEAVGMTALQDGTVAVLLKRQEHD